MEARRLVFADNGYFLRKLNQAYFAFHGSYADRPTAVSPIGDQVRQVREQSATLKEFIETMSRVSSYDDLLRMVDGRIGRRVTYAGQSPAEHSKLFVTAFG